MQGFQLTWAPPGHSRCPNGQNSGLFSKIDTGTKRSCPGARRPFKLVEQKLDPVHRGQGGVGLAAAEPAAGRDVNRAARRALDHLADPEQGGLVKEVTSGATETT